MSNAGWIVLALLVLVGLWLMMTYNGLVALRQRCRQAFSDIDVQLKQRHDLIPNLVETVKGYATHERTTLDAVVAARNAAMAAHGPTAQAQAEGMLQRAAPAVRPGRGLSRPQGQPELPAAAGRAVGSGEQNRGGSAVLQQRGGGVQRIRRELSGGGVRIVHGLRPGGVL